MKDISEYMDIIDLPRPKSKHPSMSLDKRAAQFAPFAALTGYEEEIDEVGRFTQDHIILDDQQKEILDQKIQMIFENEYWNKNIELICFIPDDKKAGGSYQRIEGKIKKVDGVEKVIVLTDKRKIQLSQIVDIKEVN